MSTCFVVYLIPVIMYRLFLCHYSLLVDETRNSSGDEIANVNFFYNIAHVEASAYAH